MPNRKEIKVIEEVFSPREDSIDEAMFDNVEWPEIRRMNDEIYESRQSN